MTAGDLGSELLDLFESEALSVSPPPDLADRVTRRVRVRRRRQRWLGGVTAVVVVLAGVVVVDHGPVRSTHHNHRLLRTTFNDAVNVTSMALHGNTLYVAMNAYPRGLVTAYDRLTGAPLGTSHVPAEPTSLAVGVDGTVWVTFAPQNAGRRPGVTEFSPNLRRRSTVLTNDHYLDTATFDVMPEGHDRALVATGRGLVDVHQAPLGEGTQPAGRDNVRRIVLREQRFGPTTAVAGLSDGSVAVLQSSPDGRSRLIEAPGTGEYDGSEMTLAASQDGVWVTTGAGRRSVLRRLSDALTPVSIGAVAPVVDLPAGADRVWTSGRTVWVGTDDGRVRLTCFVVTGSGQEPSATMSLPAVDSVEAEDPVVSGDLVIVPTQDAVYVASQFGLTSYPVPASCRS